MPIYAYKCESCGFAKDVLQKMSDAPLTDCPACAKPAFQKQLTAAGFQLKGSGWYVTDFKGNGAAPATAVAPATSSAETAPAAVASPAPAAAGTSEAAPAPAAKPTPAAD
jgi:putative FmdB family regulatory protein